MDNNTFWVLIALIVGACFCFWNWRESKVEIAELEVERTELLVKGEHNGR